MIQTQQGHLFDATLEGAPSGLAGTIGVRVVDPSSDTTIVNRTTTGVSEYPAGSGVYGVTLTAPAVGNNPSPWTVSVLWDTVTGGSPLTPDSVFTEDLIIYSGPVPAVPALEGSAYFTVSEFRARYPDLADTTTYPDVLIEQYRQLAEEAFEDACQRAFVPRTATETSTDVRVASHITPYQGYFQGGVRSHPRTLNHRDVRAVTAITAASGTDTVTVDQVTVTNGWLDGLAVGTYTITYTYGADTPPLRVKQAVMSLAREWMLSGPVTDRQTGIPVEGGGFISLALPGRFGTTGLPEVDETIAQYRFVSFVG